MKKILLVSLVIGIGLLALILLLVFKPEDVAKLEEKCSNEVSFDVNLDCGSDIITVENKGIRIDDFTIHVYHGNRVEWFNVSEMVNTGLLGIDLVPLETGESKDINGGVSMLKGFNPYMIRFTPVVSVLTCGENYIDKEFSC